MSTPENPPKRRTIRFRRHIAFPIAGLVATLATTTIATYAWWTLPLLALPLAFTWWWLWSGTDADSAGLRVRGLGRWRRFEWSQVSGISVQNRRVRVELTNGSGITLPAVTPEGVESLLKLAHES